MGYKVNKIYVGTNLVRPELQLKKIFDFSTSDLHGFTNYTSGGSGLVIDTTNHWCTRGSSNYSNGCIYKQVSYKRCWQRIKGNFNYSSGTGGMYVGIGNFISSLGTQFCFGPVERTRFNLYKQGVSGATQYSLPSGWSGNTDYYYDLITDNGTATIKVYDMSMNELFNQTVTGVAQTTETIGFAMFSGTTSQGAAYIKEYRLAYEE